METGDSQSVNSNTSGPTTTNTSCLNARGQMRWSHQAIIDLLSSHKDAVEAKNNEERSYFHKKNIYQSRLLSFLVLALVSLT